MRNVWLTYGHRHLILNNDLDSSLCLTCLKVYFYLLWLIQINYTCFVSEFLMFTAFLYITFAQSFVKILSLGVLSGVFLPTDLTCINYPCNLVILISLITWYAFVVRYSLYGFCLDALIGLLNLPLFCHSLPKCHAACSKQAHFVDKSCHQRLLITCSHFWDSIHVLDRASNRKLLKK